MRYVIALAALIGFAYLTYDVRTIKKDEPKEPELEPAPLWDPQPQPKQPYPFPESGKHWMGQSEGAPHATLRRTTCLLSVLPGPADWTEHRTS